MFKIEIEEENYIECPNCKNEILPSELIDFGQVDENKTLFGEPQTINCEECKQKLSVEITTFASAEIKLISKVEE